MNVNTPTTVRVSTTHVRVGDRIITRNRRSFLTECEVLGTTGTTGYPIAFHVRWIDGSEERWHRVNAAGSVLRINRKD